MFENFSNTVINLIITPSVRWLKGTKYFSKTKTLRNSKTHADNRKHFQKTRNTCKHQNTSENQNTSRKPNTHSCGGTLAEIKKHLWNQNKIGKIRNVRKIKHFREAQVQGSLQAWLLR